MQEEKNNNVENEEVVETSTEVEENENEEELEFTDTDDESNTTENETKQQDTPKGSKSSFFANLRREKEAKEKSKNTNESTINEEKTPKNENLYLKGVIAGTGGINPFTKQPIKDELDLKEFQLMKELSEKGKDPVNDYLEALKENERNATLEKQKLAQQEQEKNENYKKEFDEFVNAYSYEKLQEISNDSNFIEFADNFVGNVAIINIYKLYENMNKNIEKKAQELAIQKEARQTSSSGKVGKDTNYTDNDRSYLNFKTLEEFNEYERKKASNR